MALIWGLPNWVWLAVGGVAALGSLIVIRVLALAFSRLKQLQDAVLLSGRLMKDSTSSAREEIAVIQRRSARVGTGEGTAPDESSDSWSHW